MIARPPLMLSLYRGTGTILALIILWYAGA